MSDPAPRRRIAAVAVAAAALLALAACGAPAEDPGLPPDAGDAGVVDPTGDASDPAEPGPLDIANLDACEILPRAEAEAVIGMPLPDVLSSATSDVSSCGYTADPNGPVGQVEIYVGPGALKQLEIDRDVLEHAFTQPAGIGDEAWLEDGMIFARTGETWASIRVVSLDDPARFVDPLQTAMRDALGRLR